MPDLSRGSTSAVIVACVLAAAVAFVVGVVATALVRRFAVRHHLLIERRPLWRAPFTMLLVVLAVRWALLGAGPDREWVSRVTYILGILASASVIGVIVGLAAQTTLGNLFAGLQIAFTDAIRIDDIVVIGGQQGRIEEISLTYVAVRQSDNTTLILPCTYFATMPFQNWTHNRDYPAALPGGS
jgi:small-conductance mechanosensitive channel